jgi:tetratricopeptide (TPR) repeat protein
LAHRNVLVVLDELPDRDVSDEIIHALHESGTTVLALGDHAFQSSHLSSDACLKLGPLSSSSAIHLFQNTFLRAGRTLEQDEHQAVEAIVHALDYHPLAIKLTAARAAQSQQALSKVASTLQRSRRGRHTALMSSKESTDELRRLLQSNDGLKRLFRAIIKELPGNSERLLMGCAAFETTDFPNDAVVHLAHELGVGNPVVAIEALIERAILDRDTVTITPLNRDASRLRVHALLFELACAQFSSWDKSDQNRAREYVALFFERIVHQVDGEFHGSVLESTLELDKANIEGAITWAHDQGRTDLVLSLCSVMRILWYNRWYTEECLTFLPWAVEGGITLLASMSTSDLRYKEILTQLADVEFTHAQAKRRTGGDLDEVRSQLHRNLSRRRDLNQHVGEAAVMTELSVIDRIAGRLNDAEAWIRRSLIIRQELNDVGGEGFDRSQLGRIMIWQGRPVEAELELRKSTVLAKRAGDVRTVGDNWNYLGQIARQQGNLKRSEQYLTHALRTMTEIHDQRGRAVALHQLGQVARISGRLEEALEYVNESLQIRRDIGDQRGVGEAMGYLGRIARSQGNLGEATRLFEESLKIARAVGDRRGVAIVYSQLGRIALERGEWDKADRFFTRSIRIRGEVHDLRGLGADYGYRGRIALEKNDLPRASRYLRKSLKIARQVRDRQGEGIVLFGLGMLAVSQGDLDKAHQYFLSGLRKVRESNATPERVQFLYELGNFYVEHNRNVAVGRRLLSYANTRFPEYVKRLPGADLQENEKISRELLP